MLTALVLTLAEDVWVIPVSGPIDSAQTAFVRRVSAEAREKRPRLVIVEIDTPGGDVLSTLAIVDELLALKRAGIETVAFIRSIPGSTTAGSAFSAGSFVAIACRRIYMAPATVIGAAQPISQTPEGVQAADAKTVSALKKKVAAVAQENGYPVELVIAMVDPDYQVYAVPQNGTFRFVTEFAPKSIRITKSGEPLTLTVHEAVRYGLARHAESRDDILRSEGIDAAVIRAAEFSWSEKFVAFVTTPLVAMLLLLIGLAALYTEFQTPGFGAAGMVAIFCLGLLMFGHHLAGLANAPELLLVLLGAVLLSIEFVLIPGFGVAGILGGACILVGLILAFVPFSVPDFGDVIHVSALIQAAGRVVVAALGSVALFLLLLRFLPHVPIASRLVLQTSLSDVEAPPGPPVGAKGEALTPLMPGGKANIGGSVLDVVTEGEFVATGKRIKIVAIEGTRIVVRPA
jgi:membrane-bound serine protease (ClpP class)